MLGLELSHLNTTSSQIRIWVITMKRWLGIPIFDKEHVCGACSEQVMDIFGLHASVCSASGDRIKRHNAIRDSIFLFSSFADWAPIKEKPFIFSGSSERPADILVPNFLWVRTWLSILLARAPYNTSI